MTTEVTKAARDLRPREKVMIDGQLETVRRVTEGSLATFRDGDRAFKPCYIFFDDGTHVAVHPDTQFPVVRSRIRSNPHERSTGPARSVSDGKARGRKNRVGSRAKG
jgi:hypothetical protein